MARTLTRLTTFSKISAVMACVALIGYVSYLVVAHYRAQVALQESQRRQLIQEAERRAITAGYFFSAQSAGLKELADSREIAIYFENLALGMSLEYGLNASLAAVEELFDRYLQKNRLEKDPIYHQLLFLTPEGHILARSGDRERDGRSVDWSRFVRRDAGTYFLPDPRPGTQRIIISLPCLFKEKLVGQVIGVLPLSLVYRHFIGSHDGGPEAVALAMGNRYLYLPPAERSALAPSLQSVPPRLSPGVLTSLEAGGNQRQDLLATQVDISGTPLSIITFIPAGKFDMDHPRRILMATAVMALAILSGLFLVFILTTRNTILTTRLEESALRERDAETQNRLLQSEITERQEAEQRLSLALHGGELGLWDWDIRTGRVDFNDRWAEMLDYAPGELEGNIATFERLLHPDDRLFVMKAVELHLADPSRFYEVETRLLTKGGEWRWILAKGKVVDVATDGKPLRMTGTHLDITERKNAEAALQEQTDTLEQLNRTLERRVQEEIEKSREKELMVLQNEKLASIGQLAAGVAHEINNPMGFITSNLRTFSSYFAAMMRFIAAQRSALEETASPEVRRELAATEEDLDIAYILTDGEDLVRESLDGAQRVSQIVSDLKSFSRIDAPEYEETDLTACLQSALNIVTNELKYQATVVREIQPLPMVPCHPGQMNQVFMNLLLNAGQAVTQPGIITLKSWHDDASVFVSVSDNGHGIPEAIRDRIFEPFFTTKEVGKGTGLGLSITRDIVAKHNGEILMESSAGGTTFTVKLPRTGTSG